MICLSFTSHIYNIIPSKIAYKILNSPTATTLSIWRSTSPSGTILTHTRLHPAPSFFFSSSFFLFCFPLQLRATFLYMLFTNKQIMSYWLADFHKEPSNQKRSSLARLLTNFANTCHCCVAKETSLAVQKVPGYTAITRLVWTRCNLSICFTCITYAAQAIIKICISHTIHFIMW